MSENPLIMVVGLQTVLIALLMAIVYSQSKHLAASYPEGQAQVITDLLNVLRQLLAPGVAVADELAKATPNKIDDRVVELGKAALGLVTTHEVTVSETDKSTYTKPADPLPPAVG